MGSRETTSRGRLILWDVDHTLIETGGVGRDVFRAAFELATGQPMEQMADVTGRTEPDIFRETARLHGITATPELFDRFARHLAVGYNDRIEEMRRRGRALPGAADALAALAAVNGVVQSVLTGNTRLVAETKLRAFDLDRHIDFDSGGYGSDDSVRARLVAIAQDRAARNHGHTFDARTTILIGDTPSDVATGRDGGACVIAVASGKSSTDELKKAGAEIAVQDLLDLDQLRKAIYALTS